MQRWRATLTYDGTPYHGWQIQPTRPTVQGRLAEALHHLTSEAPLPQGAGRTDTGVHALAQVAHFDLAAPIPPGNLHRALNRSLPPSIRILNLTHCPADFHARHNALSKTYEYRILPREIDRETICPPFLAPYVWPHPRPLDLTLLNQAAHQILGTHDFTTFAAINPDQSTRHQEEKARVPQVRQSHRLTCGCSLPNPQLPLPELSSFRNAEGPASRLGKHESSSSSKSWSSFAEGGGPAFGAAKDATRTIYSSEWLLDETQDPPLLLYRVTGSGFLHHMVRNLVGTFVECGTTRRDPATIPQILAQKNRQLAGPTAPPQGLFLTEVHY